MNKKTTNWRLWERARDYGDMFYRRATGEIEEMESSKAISKILKDFYKPGMKILDVGCGAGHYLRSLKQRLDLNIDYTGVDATKYYIQLAKKAFGSSQKFFIGDILDLKFKEKTFDIVMCNNVILHLPPPPKKAIEELLRVSKRFVVIRTIFGERNYIIKEVKDPDNEVRGHFKENIKLIKDNGEPLYSAYLNLYTSDYIKEIVKTIDKNATIKIIDDKDWATFDNRKIPGNSGKTATRVIDRKQVSGNIIFDWKFVIIEKGN
jgi:ubiquinone/menaquinone biosynthesis C-methylase UbiE